MRDILISYEQGAEKIGIFPSIESSEDIDIDLNSVMAFQVLFRTTILNALSQYQKNNKTYNDSLVEKLKLAESKEADFIKEQAIIKEELRQKDKALMKSSKDNTALNDEIKRLNSIIVRMEGQRSKDQETIALYEEKIEEYEGNITDMQNILQSEMEKKLEKDTQISATDMIAYLSKYKIVMFGGHDATNAKLQNVIPDLTVFNHVVNLDYSVTNSADFVFINTQWFNHSLYQRVISICRGSNKNYSYIVGASSNFNLILQQMYRFAVETEEEKLSEEIK